MRMLQSKHLNFAIKYILKKHLKYCLASGSRTILNDHPVRGLSVLNRGILTPRSEYNDRLINIRKKLSYRMVNLKKRLRINSNK